ncbi:hypothetical protein [Lagierella massiliensis]|uniref:hypothetical protein n=1 Tax=Lagierella massiliensis TaxID=1689303 RepID=UPI0006D7E741|nr:hypothetical protein [Lagierella massiliensis]
MGKFKPDENKKNFESMNLGVTNQNQIPSTLEGKLSDKKEEFKEEKDVKEKEQEKDNKKTKGVYVDKRDVDIKDSLNMGVTNQNQIPSSIEKPGNK